MASVADLGGQNDLTHFMSALQSSTAAKNATLQKMMGALSATDNVGGSSGVNSVTPGSAVPSGSNQSTSVSGNEAQWIQAAEHLTGLDNSFTSGLANMIQHESGGNPAAVNNYDSNAKAGHPSQGLMQTIPSTFAAYALPGHGQILNPIDNLVAAIRYAQSRYGNQMIKSGGNHDANGNYIGY